MKSIIQMFLSKIKSLSKKQLIIVVSSLLFVTTGVITTTILINNRTDETYTISFEVEGVHYNTANTDKDGNISLPSDPVKNGYVFAGWYILSNMFDNALYYMLLYI